MKLYGHDTSPYVRRVRVLLTELGLPFERDANGWSNPSEAFLRINPLLRVPALEDDGETPDLQEAIFTFPGFLMTFSLREANGYRDSSGTVILGTKGDLVLNGNLVVPEMKMLHAMVAIHSLATLYPMFTQVFLSTVMHP